MIIHPKSELRKGQQNHENSKKFKTRKPLIFVRVIKNRGSRGSVLELIWYQNDEHLN